MIMYSRIDKPVQINNEFERVPGWTNKEIKTLSILETFIKNEQDRKRAEAI